MDIFLCCLFSHIFTLKTFNLGKDVHRQIIKIRLIKSPLSWDETNIYQKTSMCFANRYKYLLQNIKCFFRKLRWWNLDESWKSEHLKRNSELSKHKQILLNQNYFWKSIDYFWMILKCFRLFAWPKTILFSRTFINSS